MTRLMCSRDRNELEDLKSRLFRAGIRSEISSNPVAKAIGVLRLEIHIHDSDFIEASKIHQEFLAVRTGDLISTEVERNNSKGLHTEMELLPDAAPSSSANSQSEARIPDRQLGAGKPESSEGDLAEAAVLLEKEVEEVLARDRELTEQCSTLQGRVKVLDESLKQALAELARQSSNRSAAEQKLAEASAARNSLEKELDSLTTRCTTAEQSLAAAQDRLESKTRELKVQQSKAGDLSKEIASRDKQLATLAESLAQTRAALEKEKELRQVAEQKAGEHAAARKTLEQQVNRFAELQARLQDQKQRDRDQIQSCFEAVTKLRSRLNQKRTPPHED